MIKNLVIGPSPKRVKMPGDYYVDRIFTNAELDVRFDLDEIPWIWQDDCVARIEATHVVEHMKSLINFMNESWRVLKKDGELYIETPLAGTNPDLEFADPTHVRCYRGHTFLNYFTPWGIQNFYYTDKPWKFIKVEAYPLENPATSPDMLRVIGSPIK